MNGIEIQEEIENNMLEGNLNIDDMNALTNEETTQIRELQEKMNNDSINKKKLK